MESGNTVDKNKEAWKKTTPRSPEIYTAKNQIQDAKGIISNNSIQTKSMKQI